jgi:hypothetical protein
MYASASCLSLARRFSTRLLTQESVPSAPFQAITPAQSLTVAGRSILYATPK